ncbi:acetate kinase [Arachidicoccus ginsenosidimutans]|uniref:acetate/propionate family kinase n=1 Tax=Arachidicoccus sp. BS20 TaxID=1850526 RepID=UPI0007F13072|nr:acetate/propionate family kinase [Arachidicoccus sp. BS20]ANI89837.1 acetate kinase [Arachidicoccus sp. BS20]
MIHSENLILTINAGSSSIKIAVYAAGEKPVLKLSGKIEHIGSENNSLVIKEDSKERKITVNTESFHSTTTSFIEWLEKQEWFTQVKAIGHRIVHGMQHTQAEIITDDLLKELQSIVDYDPDHLPSEIEIINLLKKQFPQLVQVACFDTAFHTTIPNVAKRFAIPKKYDEQGIHRYGFHGISYSYLMNELREQNPPEAVGRVVLAHLGNGASIAAVKEGKCIDTSMGFTPAGGIVMSSRSGDLDPGVAWFLMRKGMDAKQFNNIINHQSGLLGISGISADMQQLLLQEKDNEDAALAVEIFCYQIKKFIGAYTAALNGLDALVFSGGIGENAAVIRTRICKGLQYLGIEISAQKNQHNEREISSSGSKVKVFVIPTNEELMMANLTNEILNGHKTE